ncbi:hypothetical protein AVEN_41245-1 [Araneus ventricosus]|uniref:Uncharacterized protein n=1 Tax=Araneus ventricosus TaxID=182803 RepID=A0A4Y2UMH8_ARAVE|nr:hypothetical protein AVEN_41245-1 [Araneus ventricosus]
MFSNVAYIVKRLSTNKESFVTVSPFLVQKSISNNVGEVASVRKLRSGDLLIEVASKIQSQKIVALKTVGIIPVTISPHSSLNTSKGIISCGEMLNDAMEEITNELQCQGVTQ